MRRNGSGRCMFGICRLGIVDGRGLEAVCEMVNARFVRENLGSEVVVG